uniref:Uncharacterized protein n=1 Tax=Anguilla anguilla TaxID=7936 RepID=A0A0E9UEE1_ANGAN
MSWMFSPLRSQFLTLRKCNWC